MAVVIGQVITETIAAGTAAAPAQRTATEPDVEALVRAATERVLETLRREWDR